MYLNKIQNNKPLKKLANTKYSKDINHKIALDKSSSITNKLKNEITKFRSKVNPITNDESIDREKKIFALEKTIHDLRNVNMILENKLSNSSIYIENDGEKNLRNDNRTLLFDNKILKEENAKLNELLKSLENDYHISNNK